MAFSRNAPAGLTSPVFQRIVLNSTATALNSTAGAGSAFWLSVETQNARVRFDGTSPTANTGTLLLTANSPYYFEGVFNAASKMKFVAVTGSPVLQVNSFKRVGDQ